MEFEDTSGLFRRESKKVWGTRKAKKKLEDLFIYLFIRENQARKKMLEEDAATQVINHLRSAKARKKNGNLHLSKDLTIQLFFFYAIIS